MINYLTLSSLMFVSGLVSLFLNKKHVLVVIISIELVLLSINFNFLVFSSFLDDGVGQLYAMWVLAVAAGESAIGLAIVIAYYRLKGNIYINYINTLKG